MPSYPTAPSLLEDPDLSRQWVLRRLQRALTLDLAATALESGIAVTARDPDRETARLLAGDARRRSEVIRTLIETLGSVPYSSIGLARAGARVGGTLLGLLGGWAWRMPLRKLATHTLSEYDALLAFVDGAEGIELDLTAQVGPLLESAQRDLKALAVAAPRTA